mmetsp:Transcript_16090/g.26278  ORF Transcript_16090/g.26278 Transcript_16090/m.26278 type:complete len:99 (+) Transcript_16090:217-513(+)
MSGKYMRIVSAPYQLVVTAGNKGQLHNVVKNAVRPGGYPTPLGVSSQLETEGKRITTTYAVSKSTPLVDTLLTPCFVQTAPLRCMTTTRQGQLVLHRI